MGKLFVIGNGFDRHFKLPTSVNDFIKYLKAEKISYVSSNAYDIYEYYGVDWNEYEENLSNFDVDSFFEDNVERPNYWSDRESDRDGVIHNMQYIIDAINVSLRQALNKMIKNAEKKIQHSSSSYCPGYFNDSSIVTFNYTSTLEKLFDLTNTNVLYIHGIYNSGKGHLVFGYKDADKLLHTNSDFSNDIAYENIAYDYYVNEQRELINEFYLGQKKDFQYDRLNTFLDKVNTVDEVIVLGHSMGDVDSEYMEIINQKISPQKWKISRYDNDPSNSVLSKYSFYNNIECYSIEELLTEKNEGKDE